MLKIKKCFTCKKEYENTEENFLRMESGYLSKVCKYCYSKNLEYYTKMNNNNKRWRENNLEKARKSNKKSQEKQRQKEGNKEYRDTYWKEYSEKNKDKIDYYNKNLKPKKDKLYCKYCYLKKLGRVDCTFEEWITKHKEETLNNKKIKTTGKNEKIYQHYCYLKRKGRVNCTFQEWFENKSEGDENG